MNDSFDAQQCPGICKVPTGVPGVDEITGGGIPRSRTTLVMGGPGSGKTIFALQTLVNGAREHGEPGIFVAFEENSRHIIENAGSFGWDLPAMEQEKLFFLDARMPAETVLAGGYDLSGMLASLQAKAAEMGARRIVFDSIDVLLTLLGDIKAERLELYRIHDWLTASDLTGVITTRIEAARILPLPSTSASCNSWPTA
ncbi:MAG: ATPase domain-containing protein [Armatimonadota bacterium]